MKQTIYIDADTGETVFTDLFQYRRRFAAGQSLVHESESYVVTETHYDGDSDHVVMIRPAGRPNRTLAGAVARLEAMNIELQELCGSMIATLTIKRNQPSVHPELQKAAVGWRERFEHIIGVG